MAAKAKIKKGTIKKKVITKADGTKEYHLEFEVENTSDGEVSIVISDNPWWKKKGGGMGPKEFEDRVPWLDKKGKPIIDPNTGKPATKPNWKRQRKRALQRWKNPEADGNPKIKEKDPLKIPKGGSKKVILIYDKEPWGTYADVYVVPETFVITDDVDKQAELPKKYDAHLTRKWKTATKQSFYWQGPHSTETYAFALPYPMIVHDHHEGDIEVVIDGVEGLPPGHSLVHIFPPIGVAYRLDEGDRGTSGAILLKQTKYAEPGEYTVGINYHVHSPGKLRHIARTVELDLLVPEAEAEVEAADIEDDCSKHKRK